MSENRIRRFECIRSFKEGEWLTKGKIYEMIDGTVKYDDGWTVTKPHDIDMNLILQLDGFKAEYYLKEITNNKLSKIEPIIHPLIKKVIFNPPYTICIFNDKSKQISKCDKEDSFDEIVGISICVAKHVLGGYNGIMGLVDEYKVEDVKVAENELSGVRDINFKVGDNVRIRSLKSMSDEFGLNARGDINIKIPFVCAMRYLCGDKFTIAKIDKEGRVNDEFGDYDWVITTNMIEKVNPQPIIIPELESYCDYCLTTERGAKSSVHSSNGVDMCEGRFCDKAKETYLEEFDNI